MRDEPTDEDRRLWTSDKHRYCLMRSAKGEGLVIVERSTGCGVFYADISLKRYDRIIQEMIDAGVPVLEEKWGVPKRRWWWPFGR